MFVYTDAYKYFNYIDDEGQKLYVPNRSPLENKESNKVIDNVTSELIDEQVNFIFGKKFNHNLQSTNGKDDDINKKNQVIINIFKKNNFYNKVRLGLRDQLIGGKIGLVLQVYGNDIFLKTIDARYIKEYKYNEFDQLSSVKFEYDVKNLNDVMNNKIEEKLQHIEYSLINGKVSYQAWTTNGYGLNKEMQTNTTLNLSKLPVWIIETDTGESYIKKVEVLQNALNKLLTYNNLSLEFGMFEQLVLLDVNLRTPEDANLIATDKLLNVPGAVIHADTETAFSNNQGKVETLSKEFKFTENVFKTIDETKRAMYRKFGLSWNDQLKKEPSAKAVKFQKQDIITKSDSLFSNWEIALNELQEMILDIIRLDQRLSTKYDIGDNNNFDYIINSQYVKNLLEDEEEQKKIDMLEVDRGLMPREVYMVKWGIADNLQEARKMIKIIVKEQSTIPDSKSTNPI